MTTQHTSTSHTPLTRTLRIALLLALLALCLVACFARGQGAAPAETPTMEPAEVDANLAAVPEPAATAVVALGALGALVRRLRRRRG